MPSDRPLLPNQNQDRQEPHVPEAIEHLDIVTDEIPSADPQLNAHNEDVPEHTPVMQEMFIQLSLPEDIPTLTNLSLVVAYDEEHGGLQDDSMAAELNGILGILKDTKSSSQVSGVSWNVPVEEMFLPPTPSTSSTPTTKPSREGKCHRLLTSEEVLRNKQMATQKKQEKEMAAQKRKQKKETTHLAKELTSIITNMQQSQGDI